MNRRRKFGFPLFSRVSLDRQQIRTQYRNKKSLSGFLPGVVNVKPVAIVAAKMNLSFAIPEALLKLNRWPFGCGAPPLPEDAILAKCSLC
jgi:hypothetical protein